jgi:8-oxo-dGTP diphosphatase
MSAPILAVSVLVRHGDLVLLVRRGRPPLENAWAFPGGKVRLGEPLAKAAAREVAEETGIDVSSLRQIDLAEIVDRDAEGIVRSHHVVIVFSGHAEVTAPRAGDDAADARWVDLRETHRLTLTPDTARILRAGLSRAASGIPEA